MQIGPRTDQEKFWQGEFGQGYMERNALIGNKLDDYCMRSYGVSRTDMNTAFLDGMQGQSFLEIGCNIGNQLDQLSRQGYGPLYGIEINAEAAMHARQHVPAANVVVGSAFDLPFKDAFFDVVFTSGVLIHISPEDLPRVMDEMVRCSRRYIWGFEYYAPETTAISYRGHNDRLWKADFAGLFLNRFSNLRLVKRTEYPYLQDSNVDLMYLLEKV